MSKGKKNTHQGDKKLLEPEFDMTQFSDKSFEITVIDMLRSLVEKWTTHKNRWVM